MRAKRRGGRATELSGEVSARGTERSVASSLHLRACPRSDFAIFRTVLIEITEAPRGPL